MIELHLIGIGTGNPDHLTLQAIKALNAADLILIPRKGETKADLAELRRSICADVLTNPASRVAEFDLPVRDAMNPSYREGVDNWHEAIAAVWKDTILAEIGREGRVALLVWGDPSLYDSTLRIAQRVSRTLPLSVHVVAGITSLQVLTAAHAIPLNEVGEPFIVTTGRQLRDHGWPLGVDTVAVMLDGDCSFHAIASDGVAIWWGAYLGMENELLIAGPLSEVSDRIVAAREKARARYGWIMDIYILRRA
ncbi:MAG: precorrin-6A synthase (deacetylating) [Rhodobacteraceae bacterium]|jgi:precorrin-6A synthase|uniref:precorrin-6A synthase (deacetylating) n=1 Tax=Albidovulum sp. TaxID=1872424 RepID=UPI001DB67976|nr:precorrin-6A synthase (deacetylating) [uncultured Defluviimonas sp.]MCB2124632.1 precorrin-6A synthase (deacetylating) [Paracoccaceae bacterium]MCC0070995.1 precorrin-6A synthase (deacetylating) [Paracoccaceae bacterium]